MAAAVVKGLTLIDLTAEIIAAAFAEQRISDFEAAIQFHSAKAGGVETIVTRNKRDFRGVADEVTVQTPEEFLQVWRKLKK